MHRITLLTLVALACTSGASALDLVRDGQPQAEIVIAEAPARMTKLAASELQTYILKISGATLPIVTAPGDAAATIYVGKSRFTDALGLAVDDLKHGAFRMASGANHLALLGPDRDFVPIEPYPLKRADLPRVLREWDAVSGSTFATPYSQLYRWYVPDLDLWMLDDAGTLNAVHEFLRSLGVRWYFPGELGEIVPRTNSIAMPSVNTDGPPLTFPSTTRGADALPRPEVTGAATALPTDPGSGSRAAPSANARGADALPRPEVTGAATAHPVIRTVRPDFPLRNIMWWGMQNNMPLEEVMWSLRMGINYGPDLLGLTQNCHGMKFVTTRAEIKTAHPEYYALWDGKRATDHRECGAPCLSSEGLFDLHMKYARALFDHYKEPLISLDVCDGYGYGRCRCDLCQGKDTPERGATGNLSDYVWGYIDRAARELYKTHPDRKVSGLSYSAFLLPPEKIDTLSPNLAVLLCQTRSSFHDVARRDFYRSLRPAWLAKLPSKEMYVFDYYLHNQPARPTEGIPTYFTRLIAEDLRSLKGISLGDTIDAYRPADPAALPWHAQAVMHLNWYVTSRLWWDADQDLDALLNEYFTLFYGPAKAEMKALVDFAEANWPNISGSAELVDRTLDLLSKARAAAGDGIYGQRVDLLVVYMKPLHLLRKQLGVKRENIPDSRALSRSTSDLSLDGKLDDPAFWDVRSYQLRDAVTGKAPRERTTFWTACGQDEALYLGIRCAESDMQGLAIASTNSGDAAIAEGDCIELLIETPVHSFYRIVINPAGARFETDCAPEGAVPRWTSGAKAAAHRGDDFWSLEVRLPAAGDMAREINPEQGIAGRRASPTYPWYVNVGRRRVRDGQAELSAWSPTGTNRFDVVEKFGRIWVK